MLQECFLFQSTYPAPSDGEAWGISGDLQRSSEDEETLFQPERMMLHAASQLTDLQCQQDEAIAYIMGCPCSDDDSSQSDGESSDDDRGFDSKGSCELPT